MQQMQPEIPSQATERKGVDSKYTPQAFDRKQERKELSPPLRFDNIEKRLLAQRAQQHLTDDQRDALNTLIDIDRKQRQQPEPNRLSVGAMACYSVVNQLDRPSIRCDSSVSTIVEVVQRFPVDALGWTIPSLVSEAALSAVVSSVGRIEPANGSHKSYLGTGFLVSESSDNHGIVMTNWHVVRAMQSCSIGWIERDGKIYFTSEYFIDFDGSETRDKNARARVISARSNPASENPGLMRLDVALLDVDLSRARANNGTAASLDLSPLSADYSSKSSSTAKLPIIVVGFPLRSRLIGTHDDVNWTKLVNDLFGYDFGFKRAAPGLLTRPIGSFELTQDPCQWIVGHDASTLKGSSGSPILSADGSGTFAIHFSGSDLEVNHAHSLHHAASLIRQMECLQ